MDKLINWLMKEELGRKVEKNREKLYLSDETYKQDRADEEELEKRYNALVLYRNDRMLINDYMACMRTADSRSEELAYLAGIRDTVKALQKRGLLKEAEKKVETLENL